MKTYYKGVVIETILTNDCEPVFIAVIDGVYYTKDVADVDENKVIQNAKKVIESLVSDLIKRFDNFLNS